MLYKQDAYLECKITRLNNATVWDDVTFYRTSVDDVNRTNPSRISIDGTKYQFDAINSTLIIKILSMLKKCPYTNKKNILIKNINIKNK